MNEIVSIIVTTAILALVGFIVTKIAFHYHKTIPDPTPRDKITRSDNRANISRKEKKLKNRIYQIVFPDSEKETPAQDEMISGIAKSGFNFEPDAPLAIHCSMTESYNETLSDPIFVVIVYPTLGQSNEAEARKHASASFIYNTDDFIRNGAVIGREQSSNCNYWLNDRVISRKGAFRIKRSKSGDYKIQSPETPKNPLTETPQGNAVSSIHFDRCAKFYIQSLCFEIYTIDEFLVRFSGNAGSKTRSVPKTSAGNVSFLDDTDNEPLDDSLIDDDISKARTVARNKDFFKNKNQKKTTPVRPKQAEYADDLTDDEDDSDFSFFPADDYFTPDDYSQYVS